jgi:type IV pilus assembly protein PilW
MKRPSLFRTDRKQLGLSLIELMIAITLGMLVVAALLAIYLNITRTNNEMAKANRQIENGRFAMQALQNDIVHAGFWGQLGYSMPPAPSIPAPTAIPDPCNVAVDTWSNDHKNNLLAIPVQGYADGSLLAGCNVSGVLGNSDVLVVRHANTCIAGALDCNGGTDTGPHIQASACRTAAPPEPAYVMATQSSPPVAPATKPFPLQGKGCATDAETRKLVTHIYYLATSNGQPTLMLVSLDNGAYSVPQPLIEGIEAFRVEYGIDNLGRNGLPISASNPGDGSADSYVSCPAAGCSQNDLANIVAVKIHVLARNLETTPGYKDTKSYQLGATAIAAANDTYKRHVFSTTVRLVNPSGRRELP